MGSSKENKYKLKKPCTGESVFMVFQYIKEQFFIYQDYNKLYENCNVNDLLTVVFKNLHFLTDNQNSDIECDLSILYSKIDNITSNIDSLSITTIKSLNETIEKIKEIKLEISSEITKDEAQVMEMLKLVLFKQKDFKLIESIYSSFNEFYYDIKLYELVINNYFASLTYNNKDYSYYEKVIKLYINTGDSKANSINRKILYKKLLIKKTYIEKYSDLSCDEKKRIYCEIDMLCKYILDKKNKMNNVSNLNKKYEININFKKELIKSAEDSIFMPDNYIDCTNKNVISIDCRNTFSIDDAFCFEKIEDKYVLTVYTSDTSSFIKMDSDLDNEAYKRSFNLYLPNNYIPIFPNILSDDKMSLKSKRNRYSIAHRFVFSSSYDFIIEETKIYKAIIKVNKNYSYEDVERIIKYNAETEEAKYLNQIIDFSSNLKFCNMNDDYYRLKKINSDNNSDLSIYCDYNVSIAAKVISRFMILTNHYIASTFNKLGVPFLYCNNTSNVDELLLDKLKLNIYNNSKVDNILNEIQSKYMPSKYSLQNVGHRGLRLSSYCHSTNPIRDYSSLSVQRLVKSFLLDKNMSNLNIYFWEDYLNKLAEHLNQRKEMNKDYSSEYRKIFQKKKH